ncbi:hypothetical protein PENFLA_c102G03110 [Penicillium flavigenum]|uniref:Uncharacterized protein n=1 Tax=Penicillium flavigenum TaxID=254877 RepID=A0A1V6S756_9EURO|nr:hypothetical protein PENFLA_c102G03110 [Penicillium flavigenum]
MALTIFDPAIHVGIHIDYHINPRWPRHAVAGILCVALTVFDPAIHVGIHIDYHVNPGWTRRAACPLLHLRLRRLDDNSLAALAVTACTTALLRVIHQRTWLPNMDNATDVGNVHAHTQCAGGHDYRRLPALELA